MSGTRFARTGRCRFFICLGVFIIMVLFVAIFHSSQLQLDESREERLRCEQQQEGLNEQLKTMVEQKYNLEKTNSNERNEQMEARRDLEQKLKDSTDLLAKEKMDARIHYEKLQQAHKILQSKYDGLEGECAKSKKKQLEDDNAYEKRIQSMRSELEKQKNLKEGELNVWHEKYKTLQNEKTRLEALLSATDSNARVAALEFLVADYEKHCSYKPKREQQQINKPLNPPDTTRNAHAHPQAHNFDKPRNEKSFNEQIVIVPKPIKKLSEETETQLKQQPADDAAAVVVENESVGDAPVAAALVDNNKLSTKANKVQASLQAHLKQAINATASNQSSSSSTSLPPLALPPPNQRKIPDNVAPIPEHLPAAQNKLDPADIDAAVEDMQKNENDDGNNNRYANIVNDMDGKPQQQKANAANEDSGAHEIKDHDFINEPNFNLQPDDNNFFDAGAADNKHGDAADKQQQQAVDNNDDDDDDLMGDLIGGDVNDGAVGDLVAGKQEHQHHEQHHLLDAAVNLNNEIAGDQGKEFAEGLGPDDGNDADDDEDDYSNMAARKQGEQAIRN